MEPNYRIHKERSHNPSKQQKTSQINEYRNNKQCSKKIPEANYEYRNLIKIATRLQYNLQKKRSWMLPKWGFLPKVVNPAWE